MNFEFVDPALLFQTDTARDHDVAPTAKKEEMAMARQPQQPTITGLPVDPAVAVDRP
jgi:hypothetical protein